MYLSKRGYVIPKCKITQNDLDQLKKTLQGRPIVDDKFNTRACTFPLYIETRNKLYIPKMYGIERFGYPDLQLGNFTPVPWESPNAEFVGHLQEIQEISSRALLDALYTKGGGILSLGTGLGKTVTALYVLSKLRTKTLVIVNKIPLMKQWESEIKQFLPGTSIGFLQGSKNVSVHGADIVIGMLQSLAKVDYPSELFSDFGCLVVDETHNIASRVFSQVLLKVCCKYTIGLTATPQRSDGCEYVFKWFLGDIVFKSKLERSGLSPILRMTKLNSTEYREITTVNRLTGKTTIQFTSMLTELVDMTSRNLFIVYTIKQLMLEDRKVLVLSDRRDHLKRLSNLLKGDKDVHFTFGFFIGQMKLIDLEATKRCDVILATYSAFSEGVSVKDLNTLLLVTPKKYVGHLPKNTKNESGKMEQIVGRIFRKDHTDIAPMIVDLFDNFSVYKSQANGRRHFYKTHFNSIRIETVAVDLDTFDRNKTVDGHVVDADVDDVNTGHVLEFID
ncbi:DEAD/DEAH box helicase [bacterium]|nr:DEAD/DEAH box helicase [bacterium]NDC95770.1 DEAD/DEAH box helicase [bacterium]NDD83035.1 DEAD/DEAH box helicase [bacterium]NDG31989.1 DEAD/DEAH box helicase [bacterium]